MKLKKIFAIMLYAPLAMFGIIGVGGTDTSTTDSAANAPENNGGDPTQAVNSSTGEDAVSTPEKPEQAEKTFTQAELDAQIKARLDRERKKLPTKEELDAFKKWQDSQKTAEQLSAEKITAAEKEKTDAINKAAQLEAKVAAFSKGVTAEAVDDVISLAFAKVSDDVDINAAIDAVIKKYPSFCGNPAAPKGITTGTNFTKGSAADSDGVMTAFLKRNPNLKV